MSKHAYLSPHGYLSVCRKGVNTGLTVSHMCGFQIWLFSSGNKSSQEARTYRVTGMNALVKQHSPVQQKRYSVL